MIREDAVAEANNNRKFEETNGVEHIHCPLNSDNRCSAYCPAYNPPYIYSVEYLETEKAYSWEVRPSYCSAPCLTRGIGG